MIESRHLLLTEALENSEHGSIHNTDLEVGVSRLKIVTALDVLCGQDLQFIGAPKQILKKAEPDIGREPLLAPIVQLAQNKDWDHEAFARPRDEGCTSLVVRIGTIKGSEKHARIED